MRSSAPSRNAPVARKKKAGFQKIVEENDEHITEDEEFEESEEEEEEKDQGMRQKMAQNLKRRTAQRLKPQSRVPANIVCCGGPLNAGTKDCDESIANLTTGNCVCGSISAVNYALMGFVLKVLSTSWRQNAEWRVKTDSNGVLAASNYWPKAVTDFNTLLTQCVEVSYRISSPLTLQSYVSTLQSLPVPESSDVLARTPFYEAWLPLKASIEEGKRSVAASKVAKQNTSAVMSSSSLVQLSNEGLLLNPADLPTPNGSSSKDSRPPKKPRTVENLGSHQQLTNALAIKQTLAIIEKEINDPQNAADHDYLLKLRASKKKLVLEMIN